MHCSLLLLSLLPTYLPVVSSAQWTASSPVADPPAASLPHPNPTHSFWINLPGANPLATTGSTGPLTNEADVCIIGSGITGVSAAYHLSQSLSLSTVILEARDFCSGATGRNGGHLTARLFEGFSKNLHTHGEADALRAIALERHTASSILDLIANTSLGERVDLVNSGHITSFLSQEEENRARLDFEQAQRSGINVSKVEWLSREFMNEHFGSPHPAVRFPGHTIWPLKFVTELYNLAHETPNFNITLHTRTPVTSITASLLQSPRKFTLTTPRGPIRCSRVLHATNAYASHLLPFMRGRAGIMPSRGQVMAVRGTTPTNASFDANEGFEYWFPRRNDSIVIIGGGRELTAPQYELYVEDDSTLNPVVTETLMKFLGRVFPGKFEESKVEWSWSGIMAMTALGDPFVGPLSTTPSSPYSGQYIAAGYSGHGMPRTFACAEAIAQIIAAEIKGTKWEIPSWLPVHYLTYNRGINRVE